MGVPLPALPVGAKWLGGIEVSSAYARACVGFAYYAVERRGVCIWLDGAIPPSGDPAASLPCDYQMTPDGAEALLSDILPAARGGKNGIPLRIAPR